MFHHLEARLTQRDRDLEGLLKQCPTQANPSEDLARFCSSNRFKTGTSSLISNMVSWNGTFLNHPMVAKQQKEDYITISKTFSRRMKVICIIAFVRNLLFVPCLYLVLINHAKIFEPSLTYHSHLAGVFSGRKLQIGDNPTSEFWQ